MVFIADSGTRICSVTMHYIEMIFKCIQRVYDLIFTSIDVLLIC